jgi:hypothetical protein
VLILPLGLILPRISFSKQKINMLINIFPLSELKHPHVLFSSEGILQLF